MRLSARALVAAALALVCVGMTARVVFAQAPVASMHVGATVAPTCRISVEAPADAAGSTPALRVACGRRSLRSLRVSSNDGVAVHQLATSATITTLRAGGEVVFMAPRSVPIVASLAPSFAADTIASQPVVFTLDF